MPRHYAVTIGFTSTPPAPPTSGSCGFLSVAKWGADWMFPTCSFLSVQKWRDDG